MQHNLICYLFYSVGSKIVVKIDELNINNKKLVLSMRTARADVSAFSTVGADKWIQGIVQKVTDFGMFVRPAGFDTTGQLLHPTSELYVP